MHWEAANFTKIFAVEDTFYFEKYKNFYQMHTTIFVHFGWNME